MEVLPTSCLFEVVIKLTQKILAMGKAISCLPSARKITISIGGIKKKKTFPVMGGKNGIVLPTLFGEYLPWWDNHGIFYCENWDDTIINQY